MVGKEVIKFIFGILVLFSFISFGSALNSCIGAPSSASCFSLLIDSCGSFDFWNTQCEWTSGSCEGDWPGYCASNGLNESSCYDLGVCYWGGDSCQPYGSCGDYSLYPSSCEGSSGGVCSWVDTSFCSGTRSCEGQSSSDSCLALTGCNWVPELAYNESGIIYQCGSIISTGSYTLNQSIGTNNSTDCLTISSDNITINGNGFTVTGNVNASDSRLNEDGSGFNAFTNLIVNNTKINGSIISIGGGVDYNGGNGGSINISNSNISGIVNSRGGSVDEESLVEGGDGGSGGAIMVSNSSTGLIISAGGKGYYGRGGSGGSGGVIIISNSTTGSLSSIGEGADDSSGSSGSITISNSNISGSINSIVGSTPDVGGSSGLITISNSNISGAITSTGGDNYVFGSDGGAITISNSTTRAISSTGGYALEGGDGAEITISNSNISGAITSTGGLGGDSG
ncbi:MAG: hypothetical protein WCI72_06635, partial [archaeon]